MVQQRLSPRRFVEEGFERRQFRVPFNEGRDRAETRQRFGIELPNFRDDARAVVVDPQYSPAVELPDVVAGKVDLADRRRAAR